MADEDVYTKDGTVDYQKNPAKRSKTGTWKACSYILGNRCCERLAYNGIRTNLFLYFKDQLNPRSATASNILRNWFNICYITPLIGAFLADAYLGKYWTILFFSIIYVMGMTLLTVSATVPGLKSTCSANNVCHASGATIAVALIALFLIALGMGGTNPCVSSYGADQFDDTNEVEKKHKASFFNWLYFSGVTGGLVATSVLVWIQDNMRWEWGFGIPAVVMAIAVVSFFSGTRLYRNQKPGGNPLTRICQVLVASFRKYKVQVPADKSLLYENRDAESAIIGSRKLEYTNDLSFFDKAAVETESDNRKESIDPWRLCTVTQAEELKAIIRLLPVWATGIIIVTVYIQVDNLFVLQLRGERMDTDMGNSNLRILISSQGICNTISLLFWILVYEWIIVPVARRFTGNENGLTQLQRMGFGLFLSIFSVVSAGILEHVRLNFVKGQNYYNLKDVMSILWQVPHYFFMVCAEVFVFIGQMEFFYEQAPDAMRSLCSALLLTAAALGDYLSTLLVTIVTRISTRDGELGWIPDNLNNGHVDYFYYLLAAISVLNLGVFILVAKWYTYKRPVGTLR